MAQTLRGGKKGSNARHRIRRLTVTLVLRSVGRVGEKFSVKMEMSTGSATGTSTNFAKYVFIYHVSKKDEYSADMNTNKISAMKAASIKK